MRKLISRIFLFAFAVLFYTACKKPQTYSVIPSIQFKSLEAVKDVNGKDTLTIINITFTDGDGDIGCTPACTDFIVSFFQKENGVWVKDIPCDSCVTFDGGLPYLTPDGSNKTIKGEISMTQLIKYYTGLYSLQNDTIHYEVYILDRAMHRSNTITTSDLVVAVH